VAEIARKVGGSGWKVGKCPFVTVLWLPVQFLYVASAGYEGCIRDLVVLNVPRYMEYYKILRTVNEIPYILVFIKRDVVYKDFFIIK